MNVCELLIIIIIIIIVNDNDVCMCRRASTARAPTCSGRGLAFHTRACLALSFSFCPRFCLVFASASSLFSLSLSS